MSFFSLFPSLFASFRVVVLALLCAASANHAAAQSPPRIDGAAADPRVEPGPVGNQDTVLTTAKCDPRQGQPCPIEQHQDANSPGYERGILIVKIRAPLAQSLLSNAASKGGAPGFISVLPRSLQDFARKYQVTSIEPLFNPTLTSAERMEQAKRQFSARALRAQEGQPAARLDDIFKLTMDRQVDLERAAKELSADSQVIYAEPSRRFQTFLTPNDQYYNSNDLWGLYKAQAANAWNTATGLGVVVAVVDTGVDITHSDLQGNIWVNAGETNPSDSVDNDANGFVDDVHGWNFANGNNSVSDGFGHGTHVAGTIAGFGNNSNGVVGLGFQSKIMVVKGLDNNGSGYTANLVNGLLYAVNNGADVINNSWGGGDSQAVRNMVDYAHSHGVVVVSSAGNANTTTCNVSPANAENGLTVSAFTNSDARASYSNYGVKIDVAAPGGAGGSPATLAPGTDILSTVPPSSVLASYGYPVLTGGDGKKYMPLAGTSMAAPHVSALAALLIQLHPTWTNEQIRQAIRRSADDVSTPGFDTDSGYGRINAANAVLMGPTAPASASLQKPQNCAIIRGIEPIVGISAVASGSGTYVVDVGAGDVPSAFNVVVATGVTPVPAQITTFNTLSVPDGRYTIRLATTSSTGKSEDRNVVNVKNIFIDSPADNQVISNLATPVTGSAAGNLGFVNYKLDWAPGCNATTGFQTVTTSTTQVAAIGGLGTWNLNPVPDGSVTLRLTATFSGNGGFTSTDQKCVVVDKLLAPGWPVAINHVPSFKSPKIADLKQAGTNQIILGASVFEANGSVRPGWDNSPGLGRTNPAILNVDNNPDLEIVAAVFDNNTSSPNNGAPVIYAYKPDKTVLWSRIVQNPNTTLTTYNYGIPSALSAADVDGDGKPEIVFTMFFNYYNSNYQTQVFVLNAATGAVKSTFAVPGISTSSVALADINEDGIPDLVIVSRINSNSDGLVSVVKSNGAALPGWPVTIPSAADTGGFGNIDPVVADVDMDGHLEILAGKHLLDTNGVSKVGWPFAAISRSTGVMAPLSDTDCQMEVATGGGNSVVFWRAEHNGSLTFAKSNTFENTFVFMIGENGAQGNPIVADVDGDQQVEILRPSELGSTTPNKPMPLYGSEALSPTDPTSFSRFVNTTNPGGWSDPIRSTAAVGDVDNDGKVDLLVAAGGQLYRWNLNKPFTPALSYWPMFQHDLRNTGFLPSASSVLLDPGMTNAHNTFARRIILAQTYTPTQSGKLTKITHGLQDQTTSGSVASYDLLVTTTTTAGLPNWTGVLSSSYSGPNILFSTIGLPTATMSTLGIVNGVVSIPPGQQPQLTAGTKYALVLIPRSPGTMNWRGNSGAGTYLNGSAYELNGTTWSVPTLGPKDHGFRLEGCL